jgi:hypothetical protein
MQCRRCRYSSFSPNDRRCCKRLMQRCRHTRSVQKLELVPGLCWVLNPNDDCPLFKPRFRVWLCGLFGK